MCGCLCVDVWVWVGVGVTWMFAYDRLLLLGVILCPILTYQTRGLSVGQRRRVEERSFYHSFALWDVVC